MQTTDYFSGVESLIEIGFQVVDMFEADREPDQVGRHARGHQFLVGF